jgi:hypothetical protein
MSSCYCFSVQAEASPGTLPRIVEVVALYGHVPSRLHGERTGPGLEELVVDLQLDGVTPAEAAAIAKRLGRMVTVTSVLWSEKRRLVAA